MKSTLATDPATTAIGSENIFATRAITLEGFTLHAYGAEPVGMPTLRHWQAAFSLATSSQESSPYWVGDLLAYAETRTEWRRKLDQAKSVTGLSHQTLLNQTSVSKHVRNAQRQLAPSYSHAATVASQRPDVQDEWLTKARTNGWTVQQLRHAMRRSEKTVVLDGHAACMRTVDVSVRVVVEAPSSWQAQETAWALVKDAIATLSHAHVIGAVALDPPSV